MPELNKANRQVCDVDIRILKTMAPFLFFETANTTTAGLSGDSVYAMAKGTRRIAFHNPMEGTMSIEAQVYPFKLFSLLSNGVLETDAVYAVRETIKVTTADTLTIANDKGTVQAGSVFVYPTGSFGDADAAVEGTFANGTFTPRTANTMAANSFWDVGYLISRDTGVQRVSFKNSNLPSDYYITMETLDKDDQGVLTPFLMTAYKATIQRSFELSFTSEGDPANVVLNFDLMEDKDGNILDFIELTDDAE